MKHSINNTGMRINTILCILLPMCIILFSCTNLVVLSVGGSSGSSGKDTVIAANRVALITEINKAIKTDGSAVDLNYIDTELVTDMSELFKDKTEFNGDISKWDTRNVTTMESMFSGAAAFNGDISKWDTSEVTTTKEMFKGATEFAQNLVYWDVNKVTAHDNMFDGATSVTSAQHPLWPVTPADKSALKAEVKKAIASDKAHLNYIITSNITDMSELFKDKNTFNGDISKWDTSKVTNMKDMFYKAEAFNGDISKWGYQ